MKTAFIGTGKMGGALLERLLNVGIVSKADVIACDSSESRLSELRQRLGIQVSRDNKEGARFGDIVVIGVLPDQVKAILEEIRPEMMESKVLISVAALASTAMMENVLASKVGVMRVMPNIPSLVGSGYNLVCFGRFLNSEHRELAKKALAAWGEYREVPEDAIEVYTAITAMGPTYFFPYLETLVRFGQDNGLKEEDAREAACWTMKGTAEISLGTPHPLEDLKNLIRSQPLKDKEAALKSELRETLDKTLTDLKTRKVKIGQ